MSLEVHVLLLGIVWILTLLLAFESSDFVFELQNLILVMLVCLLDLILILLNVGFLGIDLMIVIVSLLLSLSTLLRG